MWKDLTILIMSVSLILMVTMIWHVRNLISNKELYKIIPYRRYMLSNEYKNIKTGDLIYTRSAVATMQEMIIPYIYKHAGIIVEFNNTLYIVETFSAKITGRSKEALILHKGGVGMTRLSDWMKHLIGNAYLCKLNKPLMPQHTDALYDTIIHLYGEKYPSITSLYFIFILGLPIKTSPYCYSFVYKCLTNMKLLNYQNLSANELSRIITSIYEIDLNDGYKYEFPRQLIYDFECNDADF